MPWNPYFLRLIGRRCAHIHAKQMIGDLAEPLRLLLQVERLPLLWGDVDEQVVLTDESIIGLAGIFFRGLLETVENQRTGRNRGQEEGVAEDGDEHGLLQGSGMFRCAGFEWSTLIQGLA